MCVPDRACVYAGDGWTEDVEMGGFTCVYVHVCTCARSCLRACDSVCEAGMIDARSDGEMDGWMDRGIAKWMHGWTRIPAYMGTYQRVRQICR